MSRKRTLDESYSDLEEANFQTMRRLMAGDLALQEFVKLTTDALVSPQPQPAVAERPGPQAPSAPPTATSTPTVCSTSMNKFSNISISSWAEILAELPDFPSAELLKTLNKPTTTSYGVFPMSAIVSRKVSEIAAWVNLRVELDTVQLHRRLTFVKAGASEDVKLQPDDFSAPDSGVFDVQVAEGTVTHARTGRKAALPSEARALTHITIEKNYSETVAAINGALLVADLFTDPPPPPSLHQVDQRLQEASG